MCVSELVIDRLTFLITPLPCISWNAGKKFMGNVDVLLKSLINFDKDNIPGKKIRSILCSQDKFSI